MKGIKFSGMKTIVQYFLENKEVTVYFSILFTKK